MIDEEPYDYALAERIFPKDSKKVIEFKFRAPRLPQGYASEIEVQDQRGGRALKLRIDNDWLSFDIESVSCDPVKINPKEWHKVVLMIDCEKDSYNFTIDGKDYPSAIDFSDKLDTVERIVFRTGPYRNFVPADVAEQGIAKQSGFYSEDLPGADTKAPMIIFNLDDIVTRGE